MQLFFLIKPITKNLKPRVFVLRTDKWKIDNVVRCDKQNVQKGCCSQGKQFDSGRAQLKNICLKGVGATTMVVI